LAAGFSPVCPDFPQRFQHARSLCPLDGKD
jgi:hypothetical protein